MDLSIATAEPLRESTRRFLRPVVGVDPARVRVVRGAVAARAADALDAEALATDATIALPPEADEARPETMGLLAHELTHVARRADPHFVPPLPLEAAPSRGSDPEERIAGAVEQQVAAIARAAGEADEGGPGLSGRPAPAPGPRARHLDLDWGGLPKPWEALPTSPFTQRRPAQGQAEQPAPSPASPGATGITTSQAPLSAPSPGAAPPPPVQRAGNDRPLARPPAAAGAPAPGADPTPEPDLDLLARQVYALLKRRLATERRRMS